MDRRAYQDISLEVAFPDIPKDDRLPIIDWYNEDKSKYMKAQDAINPKTNSNYFDEDNDFLLSEEGNFLLNEDFVFVNTYLFKEVGEVFEETGKYIDAEIDSLEYNDFREREEHRRKHGITRKCKLYKKDVYKYNSLPRDQRHVLVHDISITGELYNFINYGRIIRTEESSINKGSINVEKGLGLPKFFYSQYWWTKAKLFAKLNGFNHVVLKSRRAGWSFQEAIDSANDANLIPELTNIFAAFNMIYLTTGLAIAPMAREQLEFYEQYTPFNRCGLNKDGTSAGLLKSDLTDMQLGFKTKGGAIQGWKSKLISVSFGPANPNAAIGKDARKIKIEELSDAPNLNEFLNVTEPTTKVGAYKSGMIIGFGTGGSTIGDWVAFKEWYFSPAKYDAMSFADVWDYEARHKSVGYFKPYIQNLEGRDHRGVNGIDEYGNPNYVASTFIYLKERADKKANPDTSERDYTVYEGQYANMPTESFAIAGNNMFSSDGLKAHYKRVMTDNSLNFYRDGWLKRNEKGKIVFKTNAQLRQDGEKTHDYMNKRKFSAGDDVYGCLREWYPPYTDENGKIPDNLYRIYYDPVAKDKKIKDIRSDNSLDSIIVRIVNNNFAGASDIPVAMYTGRTGSLEETNKFILDLADYYNAKVFPEVDRGTIVPSFIRWRRRDRLVKTPIHVFDLKTKESTETSYGINIGGGTKKADGLIYLKEWLYTKRGLDSNGNQLYTYNFIYDEAWLEELLTWNPDDNFDRVSTGILLGYDNQELILIGNKPKQQTKRKNSIFRQSWF